VTSALAKKIDALDNGGNGDNLSRFGNYTRQCREGFRLSPLDTRPGASSV